MELFMVGPTFSIDQLVAVPSTAAEAEARHHHPCIFMNAGGGDNDPEGSAIEESSEKSADYSSDSSSSIGSPSDDEDDEENAVSSKGGLASLDSMEESLPNKKGLSNHFSGKSKSFGNLSDMSCCTEVREMKDVEKPENPFNKRRRILMAHKLLNSTRRSSFYGWSNNPKSMPILAAALDELEEDEKERGTVYEDHDHPSSSSSSSSSLVSPSKDEKRKFKSGLSFKSRSCFALSDLQEEEDDDDD